MRVQGSPPPLGLINQHVGSFSVDSLFAVMVPLSWANTQVPPITSLCHGLPPWVPTSPSERAPMLPLPVTRGGGAPHFLAFIDSDQPLSEDLRILAHHEHSHLKLSGHFQARPPSPWTCAVGWRDPGQGPRISPSLLLAFLDPARI